MDQKELLLFHCEVVIMFRFIRRKLKSQHRKTGKERLQMKPEEKALHVKSFEKDLERAKVF